MHLIHIYISLIHAFVSSWQKTLRRTSGATDYGVCLHGHPAMEHSGGYSLGPGLWANFFSVNWLQFILMLESWVVLLTCHLLGVRLLSA